jgi:thiol-disulfide isomerase/thioredoxin
MSMPRMKIWKELRIVLVRLVVSSGAILFSTTGCDLDAPTDSAPANATSEQFKPSQQAAALFESSFHKLEDWNQMQSLSKWRGKYLVLNFWATWCKSCHHEVPELNKLYNRFKDKNTAVVGLAIDNADKVRDYVGQYDVDYPILVGSDEALALSKKMGNKIEGLPFTIMITPQGKVVETILGSTKPGTLPKVLTPHLQS